MKAIYRTPFFRTDVAALYLKDALANHIYCFIGREDDPKGTKKDNTIFSVGDGQWLINENDPPEPLNSIEHDETEVWDYGIAAKRLTNKDMTFVINRFLDVGGNAGTRLWSDHINDGSSEYNALSRVFSPIDFTSTNGEFVEETNCVLINEDREVFLCVGRVDDGSDLTQTHSLPLTGIKTPRLSTHFPLIEPDSEFYGDDTNSIIVIDMESERVAAGDPRGANHYVWKYICTIDTSLWTNFVSPQSSWIPINFADSKTEAGHVSAETQDDIGPDGNSPYILGLRYIIFRSFLDASLTPNNGLPYGLNFRQTWFVKNPLDGVGEPASFTYGYLPNSVSSMSPPLNALYDEGEHGDATINTFTKYSGDIFYVEHRPPVFRQEDQTEEIFAVFSY